MKNKHYQRQYCRAVVIVHGASELQIVKHIKSKLRLPIEFYSRDNGKTSIQINGIMDVLHNSIFNKPQRFLREYSNIEHHKNELYNFRVFIIMDTDDCKTDVIREQYIDGSLFDGHWLKPYISAIYNDSSLENVLLNCGVISKKLSDKEKIPTYERIFPIVSNDSNLQELENLKKQLSDCRKTNMEVFLQYCIDWAENSKVVLNN